MARGHAAVTEFESNLCGIPCKICITSWEPYRSAILRADPEDSHPAEGGCGDWEILDRNGRPAPWLERKMTKQEQARIENEIFNHMENQDDRDNHDRYDHDQYVSDRDNNEPEAPANKAPYL